VATTTLLYPFTLGLVAAVNPCGFPLLLVYLNFFVGEADDAPSSAARRTARALVAGALATVGFVVLFGSIGIVTELGVSAAYDTTSLWARWLMVVFGVAMVVAGLLALFGRSLRIRLPEIRPGVGLRRPVALFVFGVAYGVASIGCALPLFIGGVVGSFGRSGFVRGSSGFVAYAMGMGVLLTVMAVVIAVAGPAAARRIRVVSRAVPLVGASILVVVGAYLTVYWSMAIFAPTDSLAPMRLVESLQGDISGFVGDHPVGLGVALGAIIVASLLLYALRAGTPADVGPAVDGPSIGAPPTGAPTAPTAPVSASAPTLDQPRAAAGDQAASPERVGTGHG
jgi:cytochrome c-type biogenesis protein